MNKKSIIVLSILLLFMSGCGLLTLHPIFTPDELVVDNRLPGKWKSEGGYIEFEPGSKAATDEVPGSLRPYVSKFYLCTRKNEEGIVESRFLAFLVKIGNNQFMDLYPLQTEKTKKIDEFFSSHELKLHTISKLEIKNG